MAKDHGSHLQHLVPELRSLQVLLVFCLISAYELGPGPISWFIAAELFDQPGRPMAMALTSMLNWGGKFVLALLFPPLLVGLHFCLPLEVAILVAFKSCCVVFLVQLSINPSNFHTENLRRVRLPPLHDCSSVCLRLHLGSPAGDQRAHLGRDCRGIQRSGGHSFA